MKKNYIVFIDASYLSNKYYGSGFYVYLENLLSELFLLFKKHQQACRCFLDKNYQGKILDFNKNTSKLEFVFIQSDKVTLTLLQPYIKKTKEEKILFFIPHYENLFFIPEKTSHKKIIHVLIVHDIIPAYFVNFLFLVQGKTPLKMLSSYAFRLKFLLPSYLAKMSSIISISQTTQKTLKKFSPKIFEQNITHKVIYNGISKNFFEPNNNSTTQHFNSFQKTHLGTIQIKSYFFYFGGHTIRKNVEKMVKAYLLLPNSLRKEVPLLIIGDGAWKKLIFKKRNSYVFKIPKLEENQFKAMIKYALACPYPSLYEGFGLPVLETIISGSFPLLSNIPSNKEILGPLKNQIPFFNPYKKKEISLAFQNCIENKKEIIEQSKKLKKELILKLNQKSKNPPNNCQWKTSAQSYFEFFEQLIN